jgi:hypothetical protein
VVWWTIIFLAVVFIGVTKSGFGSGVGLMIVPLITGDLIAVWQYSKLFFAKESPSPARAVILKLLPGTAVGVFIGWLLLEILQSNANLVGALIRIEIGCESILLVSIHWWRIYRGVQQHLMPEPWRSYLTGGFAATSSTLAHAAGPIIAMYLLPLRLDRQLYVGTSAVYFFILNTAKLPAYYASGQFAQARLPFTLRFLPLVIVGAIFGRWLNKRINDRLYTKIVYIVTFALGWYILADGILRLFGKHIA